MCIKANVYKVPELQQIKFVREMCGKQGIVSGHGDVAPMDSLNLENIKRSDDVFAT